MLPIPLHPGPFFAFETRSRRCRRGLPLAAAGLAALLCNVSFARPSGPGLFCEDYPSSPQCRGQVIACDTCHLSTDPVSWNDYGSSLLGALQGQDFESGLRAALMLVEDLDADGDGASNLDEILVGTQPGNAESLWQPVPPSEGADNPWYAVGGYDTVVAYRRVTTLYCGHSPAYAELQTLRERSREDAREMLHATLAVCLDSAYWRSDGLARLADRRIKPIFALGADTEVVADGYRLVLADYAWDYRLWRYLLSDDRDMRELLTARYHVEDDGTGGPQRVDDIIPNPEIGGGQPLQPEHRAGMLTTQWFLMSNTMFSALPRTTAAQAYRAYLGMDISKTQGIFPVAGEPLDIDNRGVSAPACALCHSTLDPLAYAFSYYNGIEFPFDNGLYDPDRPSMWIEGWDPSVQQSVVLGQSVQTVPDWGRVAASSTYFRQAMGTMFFEHALGRPAGPAEFDDLDAVVQTIEADKFSANRLIHRIVDTVAFGGV